MTSETRRTEWYTVAGKDAWQGSGIDAYRIWMRKDAWNTMQRHEWRRTDGTTYCEGWIRGGSASTPFAKNMTTVGA